MDDVEKVLRFVEIALGFAKDVAAAGKDPVEELQKLIDIHPKLDAARADVDDAMKKKFGG